MSYPFTATHYTNLNIVQNGNFKEYSLQLLNSGNISFNTDINLNFTLVGGGGGGGGGGHNNGGGSPAYPSGGGASGGASGTYKINLSAYDSHIYYVGAGGGGGKANLGGGSGQTSYIDFQGNNISDRVDASGGNPGMGHYSGNAAGAYVESPSITGLDVIKIVDASGGAGGNGVSISNIGPDPLGNGTVGSPNNTTSYNIDYTNTTYLGSGGGGADAKDTGTPPPTAGKGGDGGNGSTGGAVGTGSDTTLSPNGGTGKDGNVPGAGGGGGGQPGINSTTDSGYSYKITFGGSGADGAIYIWFKIESPPPPPTPQPEPYRPGYTNRPGPIQYCTSRFARCNINKKTKFSSGNVTIQGATNPQRTSIIVDQSNRRGAKLVTSNQVLNVFGRTAGGPGGFGAPPRNHF
jgi:hypothetical protein